jgi:hypothetical protein
MTNVIRVLLLGASLSLLLSAKPGKGHAYGHDKNPGVNAAPEIGVDSAASAFGLLGGVLLIARGRVRK